MSDRRDDHYARTERQFDAWADERDGYYDAAAGAPRAHTWRTHRVRHMVCSALESAPREPGMRSLADVGCGRGDFTIALAREYPQLEQLTGFDFSESVLRLARSNASDSRVTFMRADVRALPLSTQAVDVAICVNVLHHVAAQDQERALRELGRIARRRIVVEIKNAGNFYYRRLAPREVAPGVAVHPTTPSRVENILGDEGFGLERIWGIFGPIWLSPLVVMSFARR
jgi:2-polyprenyl-3-methyl-5-hydroxy-6-metoxy-1,4-benzoquinol methylase